MYQITEIAGMTGVPATTIRYYEDNGLLRRAQRAPNGYRTYRDRDVERLRFVSRARTLDLPLDDLRELVQLWDDDECRGVAGRMRERVADRLADVRTRIAELTALAAELEQVEARLQGRPQTGPCDDGCLCVAPKQVTGLPLLPAGAHGTGPVACTLDPSEMPSRVNQWERVLAHATARAPVPDGIVVRFPADPGLASDLVEVAVAEQTCCSFFGFSLHITRDALELVVTAPPDAAPLVDELFGSPTSHDPDHERSNA